jgi:hypothetical protein
MLSDIYFIIFKVLHQANEAYHLESCTVNVDHHENLEFRIHMVSLTLCPSLYNISHSSGY